MIRWLAQNGPHKKRILVRVDFNVPMDKGRVLDDFRIRAHSPTIRYLLKRKNTVILLTHMGRPNGKRVTALSAKPIAKRLSHILKKRVRLVSNPFSPKIIEAVSSAPLGSIFLIENIRFWKEEAKNDAKFAKKLARLGDGFVQDAFATIHRAEATMTGIPRFLPSFGGLLLQKELSALRPISEKPNRPFIILIGGAKISTKLACIEGFIRRADKILLGGALANTVIKARGFSVGRSLFEKEALREAGRIAVKNKKLLLPLDVVVAPSHESSRMSVKSLDSIGNKDYILDIGPKTVNLFADELGRAKTVLWNGPLGLIEKKGFRRGTISVAKALGRIRAYKVAGGGDLLGVLKNNRLLSGFNHIATGGGATLALVAGHKLPGLEALRRSRRL